MTLEGKVAVVTGAGRGLGRAIARVLAAKGAQVVAWDLEAERAESVVAEIAGAGGTALAVAGDISLATDVRAAMQHVREAWGPVSILVNNAGITEYVKFDALTEEAWDRMQRVNLKGPFLVTQAVIGDMVDAGWGRVVNISSSSAQTGAPRLAHYAASKGGVIGFTKALAIEYAAAGVTVNHVPPGFVDTPLLQEGPFDVEAVAATMPMKRAGVPEDIAHAVAYLVSEEASYVTGQTLSVNGGRYLF